MKFNPHLQQAVLLRRYKRFLADIALPDGEQITIHCPNTGSMKNCLSEGSPCWYSTSPNPRRKYPNTWEIATTPAGDLAGINTGRSNALVLEGIESGVVGELQGYEQLRTEVPYGEERSRIDILLQGAGAAPRHCYVEVKNVTLCQQRGQGLFPDAVSARGTKHLRELMAVVARGHRAVLFFCVQHTGIEWVEPAAAIDPLYAATLRQAAAAGVEVLAYGATLSAAEITLQQPLPVTIR